MKQIWKKIPSIAGLLLSILSFALVIGAFWLAETEPQAAGGMSKPFGLWIFSCIAAVFAVVHYCVDTALSLWGGIAKQRKTFHIVLAVLLVIAIPMVFLVGGALGINILIWNVYHALICVLEVISIVLFVKDNGTKIAMT